MNNDVMKIALASDLHLEFGPLPKDLEFPEADILVLAGDIVVAKNFDKYVNDLQRFVDAYPKVIAIPGNHEPYGSELAKALQTLRTKYAELGIEFYENEAFEFQGVAFFAGTGWTDMNSRDPLTMETCRARINDYRQIKVKKAANSYGKLTPYHTVGINQVFRRKLSKANPDIVVMHHLPVANCVPTKYRGFEKVNGAFKNENFDLAGVKLVLHGHTHDSVDFVHEGTRIVANPRGYVGYEHTSDWRIKVVEYSKV